MAHSSDTVLTQALKHEAEEIGLQGRDTDDYVCQEQALDKEERAS